jgi:hypothetical protein
MKIISKAIATGMLIVTTASLSGQAVIFSENFESLRWEHGSLLEGYDGWTAANPQFVTPEINRTEAYGVAAAGTPPGAVAQRNVGNLGLTPDSRIQLDLIAAISNTAASSAQFRAAFGIGPQLPGDVDTAPMHFGIMYHGYFFRRDAWGLEAVARDSSGDPVFPVGVNIHHVRSIWDFQKGTAQLMSRNLTLGEEEFTAYYFDPGQTIDALAMGEYSDVTTWDTVWIRLGSSLGSRVIEITVTDLDKPSNVWNGLIKDEDGNVDTGHILGKLYVAEAPWTYIWSLDRWAYIKETGSVQNGIWGWFVESENQAEMDIIQH